MKLFTTLAVCMCLSLSMHAQFPKVKKPKVKAPKISVPTKTTSSSSGSSGSSASKIVPKNDPSGLFLNVTDNPSAEMHRKNAVATLSTLEENFGSESINYEEFKKTVAKNEKTLGFIKKLEPDCKSDKYYEQWNPLKEKADVQIAAYNRVKEIEYLIEQEFYISEKYKTPNPLTFRTESYGAHHACYCRPYDSKTKTYDEWAAAKKEYGEQTAKLQGYTHENTQKRLANMATCLENGNKYAAWASGENYDKAVQGYYDSNNAGDPKGVIERCEKYIAALERIESDYSLNLSAEAKSALSGAKTKTAAVKAKSEEYISSGAYDNYLAKEHAAKIAKVFLPEVRAKNSSIEAGAKKYVMSSDFAKYADERAPASTVRTSMQTPDHRVVKNELGLPKYQYHECWVSYKGKDGKCYAVAVYANYTYKGGGTYATVANWGHDRPVEMACENVSKTK